jgi:hypothetical protein
MKTAGCTRFSLSWTGWATGRGKCRASLMDERWIRWIEAV